MFELCDAQPVTLDGGEFLGRFLMHAVPTGLMRIRHFGLLANRVRAKNLVVCRRLMSAPPRADCRAWRKRAVVAVALLCADPADSPVFPRADCKPTVLPTANLPTIRWQIPL